MSQALTLTGQDSIVIIRADALPCRPIHFNAERYWLDQGNSRQKEIRHDPEKYLASRRDSRPAPVASGPHWRERGDLRRQMALPGTPDYRACGEHIAYPGRLCASQRGSRCGVARPAVWHSRNLQTPAAAVAGAIGRGRDAACRRRKVCQRRTVDGSGSSFPNSRDRTGTRG